MIRDYLVPALKREFAGWEIDFSPEAPAIAAFPASQEAVGRVLVYDDGDEATVCIENITHSHFNPYDENLKEEEREKIIVEDVLEFLKCIENITHSHFNPYDENLKEEEREKIIVEDVLEFLKALFADRVLLHTSADHGVGGWTRLDSSEGPAQLSPSLRYFLWSKPYSR